MPLLAALLFAAQAPDDPRAPGWDDFPVLVWRQAHAGKPPPDERIAPFGGVILMKEEDSAWAREKGYAYLVWNVAGRDALHLDADEAWDAHVERWIETHDEALLVREPCLSDPKTRAQLFATLDTTLAKHGAQPGLGFVLGDEVSLTPNGDPFDLCRCGHCEAQWKAYAEEHGLPGRAPLTDEVRVALLEDDFSLLGAWLARRRFDQERLVALLSELAARARGDRERLVALLGLRGQTAFGGVDVAAVKPFVDVLEGYPCVDTPAQVATGARARLTDDTRRAIPRHDATLTTLFLAQESPEGAAWLAWDAWMRGADALVLWDDAALAHAPQRTARLAEAVQSIRALRARFPQMGKPAPDSVALVTDADSIALSWLHDSLLDGPTWPRRRQGFQEEHGTRERRLGAWMRAADDLGIALGSTRFATLESDGFATLILADLLVLAEDDVRGLEAHLGRGGRIVVDGRIGWVDRSGSPWREDVLARLRRTAPTRVSVAPDAATGLHAFAATTLPERPTVTVRGADEHQRWWIHRRSTEALSCGSGEPRTRLFVALPAARTSAERAALAPTRLTASEPVEWIHPVDGEPLRPGDAALFLWPSGAAPR